MAPEESASSVYRDGISGERCAALDRAVWAAYGWDDDPEATTDEELLGRLLALHGERARAGT